MHSTLFHPTEKKKQLKIVPSYPDVDDNILPFGSWAGTMPGSITEFIECNLDLS